MSSIMVCCQCAKCGENIGIQISATQILEFADAIRERRTPQAVGSVPVEDRRKPEEIQTYAEIKF